MTRDHRRKQGKKPIAVIHRDKANRSPSQIRIDVIRNEAKDDILVELDRANEILQFDDEGAYPATYMIKNRVRNLGALHGIENLKAPTLYDKIDYEFANKLHTQWSDFEETGVEDQYEASKNAAIAEKIVPDITLQQMQWTSRMVSPFEKEGTTYSPPLNILLSEYYSETVDAEHTSLKAEIKELFFVNGLGQLTDIENPLIQEYLDLEGETQDEFVEQVIAVKVVKGTYVQPLPNEYSFEEVLTPRMKTELPTKEKLGSKDPEKIKVIRSPTDKNTVNESIDAVINEEFFVDEYEHSVDFDRGAGIIRIDIDRNLEAPEVPVSDLQLEAIETDVRENFQDALKNHPGVVVTVTQDRFGNIVAVLGDGDITVADDESNLVTVTTVETTDETERGFDRTQALVLEVNKEHTRTKSVKTTEDKVATFEIQQEKLIKTYEHTLRYNRKLMMVQEASLNLLIEEAAEFEEDLDTEIADAVNDIFDDEVSKFDLEAKDMQRELHKRVKQELKWEARLERESNERKLAIAQNQIFNINTALTPETFKKNRSPRRRRVSRLRKLPKIRRQKRRRMTKQEVKAFVKKRNLQLIAEQKKKKKLIKAVDVDEVEKLPKQKKRKKKQKQKVTLAENTGSQLTLMNEMKDDVKRSETEYNRNPNSQTWGHYMTSIGDLNDFIDKSSADEDKPGAVVIARHMEKSNTSNNYK